MPELHPSRARILISAMRAYEQGEPTTVRQLTRETRNSATEVKEAMAELITQDLLVAVPTPRGRRGRPTMYYYPKYYLRYHDLQGEMPIIVNREELLPPPTTIGSLVGVSPQREDEAKTGVETLTPEPEPEPTSTAESGDPGTDSHEAEAALEDSPTFTLSYPEDQDEIFEMVRSLVTSCREQRGEPLTARELDAQLTHHMHPLHAVLARYDMTGFHPIGWLPGGLYRMGPDHPNNPTGEIAYSIRTEAQQAAYSQEEAEIRAQYQREQNYDRVYAKLVEKHGTPDGVHSTA